MSISSLSHPPAKVVGLWPSASRVAGLAWPLGVFVLALLPRLLNLSAQPFWLDEVLTYERASLKPGALMLDSFQNHHMPSFFLMLSPLTHLGHPQFWLRLPSAIFGAIAVMLAFMIAARVAGRLAGVLAALILGLSPMVVAFAQEARSYTLVMTLILVALYGVTLLAQDLPAAGRELKAAKAGWLCFVLGTVAALDVLGDGLPWLLAANLIFAALLPFMQARRGFLRNVLLADLAILVLTAPFYALLLHFETQTVAYSMSWIPPLDAARVWYNFGSVYFMRVADWVSYRFLDHYAVPGLAWMIDSLLLLALGAAGWRLRRRPPMLVVLGIALLFLPCLFLLISLHQSVLLPRYLLWSAAPFAILAGVGAAALLEGRHILMTRLAVAGVAALLLENLAPYYHVETKPRWDVAARMLAAEVDPGDVIYFSDTGATQILPLYMPHGAQAIVLKDADGDLAHAEQAIREGKRVWVVYGHAGQNTSTPREFFGPARALGTPSLVQAAGSRITIVLYDPAVTLASCTLLGLKDGICG
ncbi:MAG: glycosyltransferase family 39 protein [Rhodospirillales bacterium]|nr:glycosyltransferase family 39 protein [Rhodospirillales bacterium]MDE2458530.1 glycosyltransferase family 39 protein [Rhodospirillales bacterium]